MNSSSVRPALPGLLITRLCTIVTLACCCLAFQQDLRADGALPCNTMLAAGIGATGDSNVWTFTANAGDTVIIRTGSAELTGTNSLDALVRLYSPSGTYITQTGYDGDKSVELEYRATVSGTFKLVVIAAGYPGAYFINMVSTGCPSVAPAGDQGGPMTNGWMYTGYISTGDLDAYSFYANAGDGIFLTYGNRDTNGVLDPYIKLFAPDGAQVVRTGGYGYAAENISARAATNGTYTVVVSGGSAHFGVNNANGYYRLKLIKTGTPLVIAPADQGGPMTNGWMHTGTIDISDADAWTVNANTGDAIFVRMGNYTTNGTLDPWLRILGPDGAQVGPAVGQYGYQAEDISARATTNGTYTVILSGGSYGVNGTGDYRITLAQTGKPVITRPGDQGGPMTNGWLYTGTIDLGDADVWSVTASSGESIVVRMGDIVTNSLDPDLRLYSPQGLLLQNIVQYGYIAEEVTVRANTNGDYLVVLTGGNYANNKGVGDYRISLGKTGSPVVTNAPDEGGGLVNGKPVNGTIPRGDIDVWTFYGHDGLHLTLDINETSDDGGFMAWERLYGPDGALLGSAYGPTNANITLNLSSNGIYTVVVGDAGSGYANSGNYQLRYQLTGWPFDHVVLLMMENRSFDHMLGWLPGSDGAQAGLSYPDHTGHFTNTFPLAPNFSVGTTEVPDHTWFGGRIDYNGGLCNGWLLINTNEDGLPSIGYYVQQDLPFLGQAVTNWTVCDHYFAPIMAETHPNRVYQHAAQTDSLTNRDDFTIGGAAKLPVTLPTIWDQLTNGVYYHAGHYGVIGLWGDRYDAISRDATDFLVACAATNLPQVAFVDPELTLTKWLPNGDDDHPPSDIRCGEAFMAQIYNALAKSAAYSNTVFIINFDEWGGFFDHIPPQQADVPPLEAEAYARVGMTAENPTYGMRGFRVPCLVISPWSRGGKVSKELFDHTSVLRLIEERWGLTPMTTRDATANNLADVLDFKHPNMSQPPQASAAPALCNRFTLTIAQDSDGSWVLWNPFDQKLQCAPTATGPWCDLTNTHSPFHILTQTPAQFFRTVLKTQ